MDISVQCDVLKFSIRLRRRREVTFVMLCQCVIMENIYYFDLINRIFITLLFDF